MCVLVIMIGTFEHSIFTPWPLSGIFLVDALWNRSFFAHETLCLPVYLGQCVLVPPPRHTQRARAHTHAHFALQSLFQLGQIAGCVWYRDISTCHQGWNVFLTPLQWHRDDNPASYIAIVAEVQNEIKQEPPPLPPHGGGGGGCRNLNCADIILVVLCWFISKLAPMLIAKFNRSFQCLRILVLVLSVVHSFKWEAFSTSDFVRNERNLCTGFSIRLRGQTSSVYTNTPIVVQSPNLKWRHVLGLNSSSNWMFRDMGFAQIRDLGTLYLHFQWPIFNARLKKMESV